jgi:hypothetical protein
MQGIAEDFSPGGNADGVDETEQSPPIFCAQGFICR